MRISHEAIYQSLYVQGRGALRRELTACLRTGRALRAPRARTSSGNRSFVTDELLISERPAEVADRAVPGHWEGDLILGTGRSAIGTLVERSSRFTMLLHLPPLEGVESLRTRSSPPRTGAGAAAVRDAIAGTITTFPEQLRRSLTWDQGIEMAQHVQLRLDTGLQIYFCDPRSPWQRGTNENTNGLLRQYFPKGTNLARHSAEELRPSRPPSTVGRETGVADTRRGVGRAPRRRWLSPATKQHRVTTDSRHPSDRGEGVGRRPRAAVAVPARPPGGASTTTAAGSPRRSARHFQALESPATPRCDDGLSAIIAGSCAARPHPSSRYPAKNDRRSIASTASSTNHARWLSGSHSRRLGGNNSSPCSRSHAMKFCAIPKWSSSIAPTASDGPPLCNSHDDKGKRGRRVPSAYLAPDHTGPPRLATAASRVASANARIGGTRACIRWTRGWTPRPSSCRSSVRRGGVPASGALHVRESRNRLWKARPRAPSCSAGCRRRDSNPRPSDYDSA